MKLLERFSVSEFTEMLVSEYYRTEKKQPIGKQRTVWHRAEMEVAKKLLDSRGMLNPGLAEARRQAIPTRILGFLRFRAVEHISIEGLDFQSNAETFGGKARLMSLERVIKTKNNKNRRSHK